MNKTIVEQADVGQYKIFVNEEKGVVTVVFEVWRYSELEDLVNKDIAKSSNNEYCISLGDDGMPTVYSYKGFSRCHPDDVFNEEIGIKIAKSRARMAYLKDKYKKLYKITCTLLNTTQVLGKRLQRIEDTFRKLEKDIEKAGN